MAPRHSPAVLAADSIGTEDRAVFAVNRSAPHKSTLSDGLPLETIACPQCGGKSFSKIVQRVDGLDIVGCDTCELAYLNPRPVREAIDKLYDVGYYSAASSTGVGYSLYATEPTTIRIYPPFGWDFLKANINLAGTRTLDIGCAFGRMVYWMRKSGARATGIDLNPEGVGVGRHSLRLDLRVTSLEALDEPRESFDVITMMDLIEHIADLDSFMKNVDRLLKPGGVVLVQTPNFGTFHTYAEKSAQIYVSLEHLLYFEQRTMDRLFARYGMQPATRTRVLCTAPADVDGFLKATRASDDSSLRRALRAMPGALMLRTLRARIHPYRARFPEDETQRLGNVLLGLYRKL